ncbi:MAG: glycosyltransferase, partial [Enterococcus sp.]|nr:glycosyltransferase [Enterococcus sp.]
MKANNKKILLIHHRLPYPLYSGMDKARFTLIKMLNNKFIVTLIVLQTSIIKSEDIAKVEEICSELIIVNEKGSLFRKNNYLKKIRTAILVIRSLVFRKPHFVISSNSRKFKKQIRQLCRVRKFDIIQPLSDYTLNYVSGEKIDGFKFFGPNDDMVGMTESILLATDDKLKRLLLKIDLRARKKWQTKMIASSDKICYFSKNDINNIIARDPYFKKKLLWMPGIIEHESDWNQSSIYSVEKNTLVFTGGLISAFNKISAIYFLDNIWPLLIEEIRDIKLYIVGQTNGNSFRKKYTHKNIIYTGRVQSVQPFLERSAVFISPVICGTGIKTKIIEALRFGKPIVSTPQGVSGLWEINANSVKIETDPEEFSKKIIQLLNDEAYRIESSLNSRKLFEEYYSFDALI